MNADQSLTLFRILQESLNNVVKHAQASRVNIVFSERDDSLLMVVKDNGIGFDRPRTGSNPLVCSASGSAR